MAYDPKELERYRIGKNNVVKMILGIYGHSDSGKTSLIERLITELTWRGYTISTIKHTRGEFSVDSPGKDTDRHRKAGAKISCLISTSETGLISSTPLSLKKTIQLIETVGGTDVILVEGGKTEKIPKIAVGEIEAQEGTIFRYKKNLNEIIAFIEESIKTEKAIQQD